MHCCSMLVSWVELCQSIRTAHRCSPFGYKVGPTAPDFRVAGMHRSAERITIKMVECKRIRRVCGVEPDNSLWHS